MKKQWVEPQIMEIPVAMTEELVKSSGSGDGRYRELDPWHDCCCS